MTHPIELGRRVALHDDGLWRPLKGLASVISQTFGLPEEFAHSIIIERVTAGDIAHRAVGSKAWISSPRAAELARRGGLSYEDHIDWVSGSLMSGVQPVPIEVFWPDVEKVASGRA